MGPEIEATVLSCDVEERANVVTLTFSFFSIVTSGEGAESGNANEYLSQFSLSKRNFLVSHFFWSVSTEFLSAASRSADWQTSLSRWVLSGDRTLYIRRSCSVY